MLNNSLYQKNTTLGEKIFAIVVLCLIGLMAVLMVLNTFVFFTVSVSGESMETTLHTGDCLVVNKLKDPVYGDIIIADHNGKLVIKRVIALGGDSVKIEDGKVYRKSQGEEEYKELAEPYAYGSYTTVSAGGENEWVLSQDEIFYMGDNRTPQGSVDCRDYGAVKQSKVKGVVTKWSINVKGFLGKINGAFN